MAKIDKTNKVQEIQPNISSNRESTFQSISFYWCLRFFAAIDNKGWIIQYRRRQMANKKIKIQA